MKDLQALCQNLGFTEVQTYIQSGNIVFNCEQDKSTIKDTIQTAIKKHYNFDVPVLVIPHAHIKTILKNNLSNRPVEQLYFTLLSQNPSKDIDITTAKDDTIIVTPTCVYVDCVAYGKTKFSNTFLEKHLGVNATTRNYNTLLKLSQM